MVYFLHSIGPVTPAGAVLRQKVVNKCPEVFWRVPSCSGRCLLGRAVEKVTCFPC